MLVVNKYRLPYIIIEEQKPRGFTEEKKAMEARVRVVRGRM
jgi:hypothetical protein